MLYLIKQPVTLEQVYCLIEAKDIHEAIRKFHWEWYGANEGGEEYDQKALFINDCTIIQNPPCEQRHLNEHGEYMCGQEDPYNPGCGEGGMCCIHNEFDTPLGECPIKQFFEAQPYLGWLNLRKVSYQGRQLTYAVP